MRGVHERSPRFFRPALGTFLTYSVTGKLYGKEIERSNKTGENVRYQTAHTERQYVVNGELNLR